MLKCTLQGQLFCYIATQNVAVLGSVASSLSHPMNTLNGTAHQSQDMA